VEWAERTRVSLKALKLRKISRLLRRNRNYGTWAPTDNSKYTQASRTQANQIISWTLSKLLMMRTITNLMEAREEASSHSTTTQNQEILLMAHRIENKTPKWTTVIFKKWRINTEITIETNINLDRKQLINLNNLYTYNHRKSMFFK